MNEFMTFSSAIALPNSKSQEENFMSKEENSISSLSIRSNRRKRFPFKRTARTLSYGGKPTASGREGNKITAGACVHSHAWTRIVTASAMNTTMQGTPFPSDVTNPMVTVI